MSNMSYCRFRNTVNDLYDCYENMDDEIDDLEEKEARETLVKICVDIAIDYGHEVGMECELVD